MPKGRANPALVIWVASEWRRHSAIVALEDAGHVVLDIAEVSRFGAHWDNTLMTPDLILHPAAHGWNDEMWDYLKAALSAAHKRRKERKA